MSVRVVKSEPDQDWCGEWQILDQQWSFYILVGAKYLQKDRTPVLNLWGHLAGSHNEDYVLINTAAFI